MSRMCQVIDLAEYRRRKQIKLLPRKAVASFAGRNREFQLYLKWMRLTALMGGE